MSRHAAIAAALALLCGCKGDDAAPAVAPPPAPAADDAVPPPPVVERFDAGSDEAAALQKLGARPAWQTVIERAELLARRGQEGVARGTLVRTDAGELVLVDDQAGDGALGIAVRAPAGMQVETPFRALVWGSWVADEGRWLWQATRVARLGAADEPATPPGLVARAGEPPAELAAPDQVDRRGGAIAFAVVGAPDDIGDGWLIAGEPGAPAAARLFLPGEREPYGAQSYLAAAERWQLELGRRYWIEVGRVQRARGGGLPILRALGPPKLL